MVNPKIGSLIDEFMKTQKDFEANGMVSVWIGDFSTDVQFDRYMNLTKEFEKDFGFTVDNGSIREGVVENSPRPIAQLVEGFSRWKHFVFAVAESAEKMGICQATTMIVFYGVNYNPLMGAINSHAPLKFVGAFRFN